MVQRKLLERAELLRISLSEEEEERVLRDLRRWLGSKLEAGLVRTEDGSPTLVHPCGEPYHSITAGAITECREKFLKPSGLLDLAREKNYIRILDVGFGLGYNVAVAVYELRRINPKVGIEIISLEREIPEKLPILPEPYREIHEGILSMIPEGDREGVRLRILLGDARERIRETGDFFADAVFHDPFSPYKNPELWSLEFLREVKWRMDDRGRWVSYSSALPVRKALLDLGFKVGITKPVGRRRGGTVASIGASVRSLPEKERVKLESSPFSVPFRDPDLRNDPLDILIDYRLSVLLREREIFSAQRRERRKIAP